MDTVRFREPAPETAMFQQKEFHLWFDSKVSTLGNYAAWRGTLL
jgi:hypothetical protein